MLEYEAFRRPTTEEAVQHYWLQEGKRVHSSSKEVKYSVHSSLKKLENYNANNIIQKAVLLYLAANQF